MPTFLRFPDSLYLNPCQGSSSTSSPPLATVDQAERSCCSSQQEPAPGVLTRALNPESQEACSPCSPIQPACLQSISRPTLMVPTVPARSHLSGLTFPWANRLFLPQQGSYFLLYHYLVGREGGQSGSWGNLRMSIIWEAPASGDCAHCRCPPGWWDFFASDWENRLFLTARESQVCLHQCLRARVQFTTLSLSKS